MSDAILPLIALGIGWAWAHHEIATECERQGSFYVNETNYLCAVEPAQPQEPGNE